MEYKQVAKERQGNEKGRKGERGMVELIIKNKKI